MKGSIYCYFQFFSDYKVVVKEEDNMKYQGGSNFMEKSLDYFWNRWAGFPHKVTLTSPKKEPIVLEKKLPSPGSKYDFLLYQGNKIFTVEEGRDYTIPDLLFKGKETIYTMKGKINELNFFLMDKETIVSHIQGERMNGGKVYYVEGDDELLSIGATLVLDNLYHDY
ncbi:MAG: hypothetical protein Q4Q07_02995 [Tissierellia bacterium]|nr:hypothetical protein [Tissierellia bacterium]